MNPILYPKEAGFCLEAGELNLEKNIAASEELTKLAQRRGHPDASHILWIGKEGGRTGS